MAESKWTSDKIFSVSAFVISLATLVTLVYQSKIMREHEEKSSFPKLEIWNNRFDSEFRLEVRNAGLGPAIIENIQIAYKDSLYDIDPSNFAFLYLDSITRKFPLSTNSLTKGRIIEAGDKLHPIGFKMDTLTSHPLYNVFRNEAELIIHYSSVYEQLWKLDGRDGNVPILIDSNAKIIESMLGN